LTEKHEKRRVGLADVTLHIAENKTPAPSPLKSLNKTVTTKWIIYEKLHNSGTTKLNDFKLRQGDMSGNI